MNLDTAMDVELKDRISINKSPRSPIIASTEDIAKFRMQNMASPSFANTNIGKLSALSN